MKQILFVLIIMVVFVGVIWNIENQEESKHVGDGVRWNFEYCIRQIHNGEPYIWNSENQECDYVGLEENCYDLCDFDELVLFRNSPEPRIIINRTEYTSWNLTANRTGLTTFNYNMKDIPVYAIIEHYELENQTCVKRDIWDYGDLDFTDRITNGCFIPGPEDFKIQVCASGILRIGGCNER